MVFVPATCDTHRHILEHQRQGRIEAKVQVADLHHRHHSTVDLHSDGFFWNFSCKTRMSATGTTALSIFIVMMMAFSCKTRRSADKGEGKK